jgi:error-prone DNA polymerase
MGFYHPSVLVEDAKRHGVAPLPVDVNASAERCLPAERLEGRPAFRVGFNYVRDLGEPGRLAIVSERDRGRAYASFDDFLARLHGQALNPRAVRNLVMVGAFDALGEPRRKLLWAWQERWHGRGLRRKLDSQSELELPAGAPPLSQVNEQERTRLEYRISGLSTGRHLVEFYRERMRGLHALTSAEANRQLDGSRVRSIQV